MDDGSLDAARDGSLDATQEDSAVKDAGLPVASDTSVPLADSESDAPIDATPSDSPLSVTTLSDVTLDSGVRYQLLRLERGSGDPAFAQWFPPPDGGARPAVLITKPYDGIDWTGEAVDQRWADAGAGLHPDLDGPGDKGSSPLPIQYTPLSPERADDGFLFRLHNFGALLVYGRFYAGGDVQNDIDDMTLGLDFLAQSREVDDARIGIWGSSWGGFEALYGAAYAQHGVRVKAGASIAPLSDFEREVDFVTRGLPALYRREATRTDSRNLFEPYLRRIRAVSDVRGFGGLRAEDLAERVKAPFLLVHEDWDTLVSFDQSQRLVALSPEVFSPFWLLHTGPPAAWDDVPSTHGPLLQQWGPLSVFTFISSFLITRLADAAQPIFLVWDTPKMTELFAGMHALQLRGVDVGFFAPRLLELCQARITVIDAASKAGEPAAAAVARELNRSWRTTLSPSDVGAALAQGLPAP